MARLTGGEGPDTIKGSNSDDYIQSRGGNDIVIGSGGNDAVFFGAGSDSVSGGDGNDIIMQGELVEGSYLGFNYELSDETHLTIDGGAGDDVVMYEHAVGGSAISGGAGTDFLFITASHSEDYDRDMSSISGFEYWMLQGSNGKIDIDGVKTSPSNIVSKYTYNDDIVLQSLGGQLGAVTLHLSDNNVQGLSGKLTISAICSIDASEVTAGHGIVLDNGVHNMEQTFVGSQLSDEYFGSYNVNNFEGQGGDDYFDGGDAIDIATYSGNASDYAITEVTYNKFTIADARGIDGIDTLVDVNLLKFADQTVDIIIKGMEIVGEDDPETLEGGVNADHIDGAGGNDDVAGSGGNDLLEGGVGNDVMSGGSGNDFIFGDGEVEISSAGAKKKPISSDDKLSGGNGNDHLVGGSGKDVLSGGAGQDTFVFSGIGDSSIDAKTRDAIKDFVHGLDIIDLQAIDAIANTSLDDAFQMRAKEGSHFTGKAGQLIWDQQQTNTKWMTLISIDDDGDKKADFTIEVGGKIALDANDFLL